MVGIVESIPNFSEGLRSGGDRDTQKHPCLGPRGFPARPAPGRGPPPMRPDRCRVRRVDGAGRFFGGCQGFGIDRP